MTALERASPNIVVGQWRHILQCHSQKHCGEAAQNFHLKSPDNLKPAYTKIYLVSSGRDLRKGPMRQKTRKSEIIARKRFERASKGRITALYCHVIIQVGKPCGPISIIERTCSPPRNVLSGENDEFLALAVITA